MAAFLLLVLLSVMAGRSSGTWCVCKEGVSDTALQKTLDYACGAGADCNPTHQNGPCFNPNTVRAHCSYAVNSYFQKYRQTPTACDFAGTATITNSDPSMNGCAFPATASSSSSSTPVTTVPGTSGMPTTTTSNGGSPFITTPSTGGILGGASNGLGPAGTNSDFSHGGIRHPQTTSVLSFSMILTFFALLL